MHPRQTIRRPSVPVRPGAITAVVVPLLRWALTLLVLGAVYLLTAYVLDVTLDRPGRSHIAVTLPATAVVGLALPAVAMPAGRVAERLLVGVRLDPRAAADKLAAATGARRAVLDEIAGVVAAACGARRCGVLLAGSPPTWIARWPAATDGGGTAGRSDWPVPAVSLDAISHLDGFSRIVPVVHRDALVGAIALDTPTALRPVEERLVRELAGQAGLVLDNARLLAELEANVASVAASADQVRESRTRIAQVHLDERRRLERDIHDGVQQHVVALAVKLGVARSLLATDVVRAREVVGEVQDAAADVIGMLEDLSAATFPAALLERGLLAALHERLTDTPGVRVEAGAVGRFPHQVESAAYFIVLEALSNAMKYAPGASIVVRVADDGGWLLLVVGDDGQGFDKDRVVPGLGSVSMAQRAAAVGGYLHISSAPGAGTAVTVRLPGRSPR